ncbi:Tetrapyrrole (Corrin/Porphyrin) Methylases [Luteibacter sp. UNCMF331Sha3.1]|uniref:SAM-dependent methyltransferase n=1 Tax=Luteibacter sp. UNCMF331Sha3.1 TaxID=1502760 RepID=UPI0008B4C214|nr:SAM-dependent methyltransferase [Luteibacter sp. UNCMF331Sha3.1]SEM45499.1 Tetrapyrrole (Corrin/Porphyrin) Methylases [Luteibacter sp. UNCMF331Sha3.1]
MTQTRQGTLACVGLGITLGSHLTPLARSHIASADVVFAGVSDGVVEAWVRRMHHDVRSLQGFYAEGKPRGETYREMADAMLAEVRLGQKVCGVFYGHPGVFAQAPHDAIARARAEGFTAIMEPGVSSEDCLYADLGLDPGRVGCMHLGATQFMLFRRTIDTSAWLVLWQVGLAGDLGEGRFDTDPERLAILTDVLRRDYPADHGVIVYQAPTLPFEAARMEHILLSALPGAAIGMADTLVVPPCRRLAPDPAIRARLAALGMPSPT